MAADADEAAGGLRLRDDVRAQRARIVARLRQHGRMSCAELASVCDVPSVTKRISELRAEGWPIEASIGHTFTRRGAWRRATFYALTGPDPQPDLFASERIAS